MINNNLFHFKPGELLIDNKGEIAYITGTVLTEDNKKRIYVKFFKEPDEYVYAHYELASFITDANTSWKYLPLPPKKIFD